MKICGSQDNLKRYDAKVAFSCIRMGYRLNQQFHSNLFKNEMGCELFRIVAKSLPRLGQAKAENIAAGGNGNILLRVDPVCHRRCADVLPGIEVP